ncbi:AAA family ATPase [Rhodospirillum sp. A1_3_36]|uniref:AAA family ATPase n=1 Tax=Rhodospirillum sp. A1_3_36 TaxID=3391666 RepID=UPI0039A53D34
MRPVLLTMQAFGPYAGREVVDFRAAIDAGLFGIYGQTGSGKSMIFTAMTFALFGDVAKAGQAGANLRSDHTSPDLPTEVSFLFDLGERRYLIRRKPEQTRPKQRGEGVTLMKAEAWLFDATGQSVEDIQADRPGKVLAEKKLGEVRDAVADLLGYGLEQFKRIVLLPQSQFEAFLTANTPDRVKILRDLFDVSLYRRLKDKLKADASDAERRVREEREIQARRLTDAGFDTVEALTEGIATKAEAFDALRAQEAQRQTEAVAARKTLEQAQALEALFKNAAETETALNGLLAQSPAIDALDQRIQRAERAKAVVDLETALIAAQKDLAKAMENRTQATKAVQTAVEKTARAKTHWEEEEAQSDALEALRAEVTNLVRHGETLEQAEGLAATLKGAQATARKAKAALETIEKKRAEALKKQTLYDEALAEARRTESARQTLSLQRQTLEADAKAGEVRQQAEADLAKSKAEVTRLQGQKDRAAAQLDEARKALSQAEAALTQAKAWHLASDLSPGTPCPVCGSVEHPAPATEGPEETGLAEALENARAVLEDRQTKDNRAAQALARAEATLEERTTRLDRLDPPSRPLAETSAALDRCRAEIEALGPARDIPKGETELAKVTQSIKTLETQRETARDALSRAERETDAAAARHEQAISSVPEALRDRPTLEKWLDERTEALKAWDTRLAKRKKALEDAEKALGTAQGKEDTAAQMLADRRDRQDKAWNAFTERLADSGLDDAGFQALKPAIDTLEADRTKVTKHREDLTIARTRLDDIRDALGDKARPDLPACQAEAAAAEQALTEATNGRATAASALGQMERLKTSLEDSLRQLAEEETRTGPLRELATLCDAGNDKKLDLETFAIGAMFDQVLASANLRMGPMTSHRYTLEREEEEGKRGRRGLGIQVLDIHTGKARPTATLSGGETFIAALALALGLADVVESASGKVRLDTIFIDEGFGSLDTENGTGTLDQVLRVLNDLVGRNRAVGLISHVPLVREAIPNGFHVHKTLGGSQVQARGFD